MEDHVGLRERKSARMLEAIQRAAFELALEQGWDHTTVAEIADRADVAPRTIFSHYPTKDAIVFGDEQRPGDVQPWLEEGDGDLVDRLTGFIREKVVNRDEARSELSRLRWRAVLEDPYLHRALRGRLEQLEDQVVQRLQSELALPAGDSGPRVVAAAVSGLFLTMIESAVRDPDAFDPFRDCARGLTFLRAGMDALAATVA